MGTGKTTVGRRVAEMLNIPFFDIDQMIERQSGSSVAQLFNQIGERGFRQLESEVIETLSSQEQAVIATGGGALINPKNRKILEREALLVCLTARTETVLERLKDDLARPLVAGDDRSRKVERLMQERQAVYSLCPIQVVTDGKTIAQVAEEVVQRVRSHGHPS